MDRRVDLTRLFASYRCACGDTLDEIMYRTCFCRHSFWALTLSVRVQFVPLEEKYTDDKMKFFLFY